MTRLLWALLFCFSLWFNLQSQSNLRLGEWQSHLPYQQGNSVTQSPDKVIYSTPYSLVIIDKEEGSTEFLSKVEGLSDVGISQVVYDPYNDQTAIIYQNSQIDFVYRSEVINIPNIATNRSIVGDRRINDVFFANSNLAFFATGFGIVVFDAENYIFGTTTFTGIPINSIAAVEDFVYAATDEGLYRAPLQATNLADFNEWDLLSNIDDLPFAYEALSLTLHKGKLIVGTNDGLIQYDGNQWQQVFTNRPNEDLSFINASEDRLIAGWSTGDFSSIVRFFDDDYTWLDQGAFCSTIATEAIRDESGRIWYADGINNFRKADGYQAICTQETFPSPFSQKVSDIVIGQDLVLAASGGVSESFGYLFGREGLYLQQEKVWRNLNEFEDPTLKELEALSLFRAAIHPTLPKIFGGSYWAGLIEYDLETATYQLYNKTNSTLRGSVGDPARERITGLAFDEAENLWVATYNAPQPLNRLSPEGNWESYSVTSDATLSDLVIDDLGNKWCPVFGNSGGILVFESESQQRFISRSNSNLPTNQVNSVVVDLEGDVWVGTAEGPVLFDCGADVFNPDCVGIQRVVFQDSIGAVLLGDQDIRVIAVDGANNKWFGTRNGVFVQSPDGEEQLAHFTTSNSPLFDNEIQALAFDGDSGEMFIGTNKGILSYRTTTTAGASRHLANEVYAFPNPVRPDYIGPISIKGLVQDAVVKITDVDGVLVSEMQAQGGQAVWDGKDLSGRQASAGVYLVWSTEPDAFDGPDAYVTKIVVVR